jgi:hypothetical protein
VTEEKKMKGKIKITKTAVSKDESNSTDKIQGPPHDIRESALRLKGATLMSTP